MIVLEMAHSSLVYKVLDKTLHSKRNIYIYILHRDFYLYLREILM